MPRQHRRRSEEPLPPASGLGWTRHEQGPDGEWVVRSVPGDRSGKTYRCPGCDHEIRPGIGHVVAWPADAYGGLEDRRHWHTTCWAERGRRRPSGRG
ncbi:MAG: hypothetical protein H0W01_01120 [Pseudonocardiales bacterium]|nr:hypothetical protein [Pseudonocardiales bacterium]